MLTSNVIATQRSAWVSFNDDIQCTLKGGDADEVRRKQSPVSGKLFEGGNCQDHRIGHSSSSIPCQHSPVHATESEWIKFDDQPWPILSPIHSQSTGSREPRTSEGSWTTQSEEPSNLSMALSHMDLHSIDIEDMHSNNVSRSSSPGNCSLQDNSQKQRNALCLHEDTKAKMRAIPCSNDLSLADTSSFYNDHNGSMNRRPDNMQTNECRMSTARFSTWVTFDDDPEPMQATLSKQRNSSSTMHQKNPKAFPGPESETEKTASTNNLLDFRAEEKNDVLSPIKPALNPRLPTRTTNPFLDEALRDVQPSSINPFQAFFERNASPVIMNSLPNNSQICQQLNELDSTFNDVLVSWQRDSTVSPNRNQSDQRHLGAFRNSSDLLSSIPAVNISDQDDSVFINSPNPVVSSADLNVNNQRESTIFTNAKDLIPSLTDVKTNVQQNSAVFANSPDQAFQFPPAEMDNQRDFVFMNSSDPVSSFPDVKINSQADSIVSFGHSPDFPIPKSHINGQRNSIIFNKSLNPTFTDDSLNCSLQNEVLSHLKQIKIMDPDQAHSPTIPDDSLHSSDRENGALNLFHLPPKDGWTMMLRIPEKKNIMSSRHWGPIYVKMLDNARLQLFYEKGLQKPFREIQLLPFHELSELKLQNFDENGKIHTIRIDQVLYREKRKYHPLPSVVQTPVRVQVIKLGTTSYEDYENFVTAIQDTLMKLPSARENSASYFEEEITVEVRDEFRGLVAKGDNRLVQHCVVTHVSILAFVSGMPESKIGLNDIQMEGNEVVSRHDIIPTTTTKWIKISDCQFHKCVDIDEFNNTRLIKFLPLDGHKFELMRFRTTFSEKSLPFSLKTLATVKGAEVELQSWLVMSSGFVPNQDQFAVMPCENVMIRYPVPMNWVKNFRREGVLREKSLKARVNRSASFGSASVSSSEPVMRVTLGSAKYENAFKSIVWRINRLPDKNSASGHPHSFYCHLELGSDREVPANFVHYVDVEFDMPSTSASKTAIRSISVANKTDVRKWVVYKAHYNYQVEMEQKRVRTPSGDSMEADHPDECVYQ